MMPEKDVEVTRRSGQPVIACYGGYVFAIVGGRVIDGEVDPDEARIKVREMCQWALDNGMAVFVEAEGMSG